MQNNDIRVIGGYKFDLLEKIYLHHPNNKFWEVAINGKKVTYRVGKLSSDEKVSIEEVSKEYASVLVSKRTVEEKILQKLTKGYFSKTSQTEKNELKKQEKNQVIKKQEKKQQKTQNQAFSGQFYEKENQSIKLQINDNKVKITRTSQNGNKQGFEIRNFVNNQKAVLFCLEEQAWYLSAGYKQNSRKFLNTFCSIKKQEQQTIKINIKQTKPKQDSIKTRPNKNLLSITYMTDEAISHRSRNNSSCKSDRSFHDDGNDTHDLKSSKLGQAKSACISVLLAETWNDEVDPEGWIMSEKLDGVRCFWTGTAMYSRNANRFYPPKFFTQNWPKSQLDGQLFIDRGQFSKTISAIKKNIPIDQEWRNVKFLVFDAPGLKKPFKERIKVMQDVIKSLDNQFIKCHYHRQCKGYLDLFEELDKVNKIQGEGLMLRDPNSLYENRRSKSLLKVKTFHDDEAVVLGYKPGTGRCAGMVGALRVRNTHGIQFEVGSGLNDDLRRRPPKIGSKITYKYQEFNKTSGKPRFPTFLRIFEQKI